MPSLVIDDAYDNESGFLIGALLDRVGCFRRVSENVRLHVRGISYELSMIDREWTDRSKLVFRSKL